MCTLYILHCTTECVVYYRARIKTAPNHVHNNLHSHRAKSRYILITTFSKIHTV